MMKGANKSVNINDWDALVQASCHAHADVCMYLSILLSCTRACKRED